MKYNITSSHIRNTEFVAEGGSPSYEVVTPTSANPLATRTTTIKHGGPNGTVVAEIDWHQINRGNTEVRFMDTGESIVRKQYLKGSGWKRTMTANDGLEYEWSAFMKSELFTKESPKRQVAYYVRNIFSGGRPQLVINPEFEKISDSVVVSFVIIEKMRRDRRRINAGGAGGT